jgi:hypothetical protein
MSVNDREQQDLLWEVLKSSLKQFIDNEEVSDKISEIIASSELKKIDFKIMNREENLVHSL